MLKIKQMFWIFRIYSRFLKNVNIEEGSHCIGSEGHGRGTPNRSNYFHTVLVRRQKTKRDGLSSLVSQYFILSVVYHKVNEMGGTSDQLKLKSVKICPNFHFRRGGGCSRSTQTWTVLEDTVPTNIYTSSYLRHCTVQYGSHSCDHSLSDSCSEQNSHMGIGNQ